MAANEELISEYIDLSAVTGQTDSFLAQIKRLNDAYDALSQKGINLGGATSTKEITAQIKELQGELARLQKAKESLLDTDLKAARIATENERAILQQAKASKENAAALLLEAKAANEAERAKIAASKTSPKAEINQNVPFTSNLAELEAERNAAAATGIAVNQLERDQVEASIAATEWANAQKGIVSANVQAAKATKLSADELERNEKILVEEKILQTQRAAALKNQVASENAVKGSLEQRRLALIRLNAEYDRIGPQERSSAAGLRLQKIIGGLSTQVKTLEADTGRAQRNVGNYGSAFEKTASNFDKFGQALGKGFGVIRQAAYILPGIGIAGIIGGATDAIISFATAESEASKATEELAKAQKELDQVLNQATGSAVSQGEQVRIIARAVTDANLPYEERKRALEELQKINKTYFGDLTLEGDIYGALQKKVQDYTTALILSSVQKARGENLTKANIELADTRRELQGLDEKIRKRQEYIQLNFEEIKARGLTTLAGVQSANDLIARDSKILGLAQKRIDLYGRLGKATDDAGQRAIEYEDATRAALSVPGLDKVNEKQLTALKTFLSKESDAVAKYYQQLEKDLANSTEIGVEQRKKFRLAEFEDEKAIANKDRQEKINSARSALNDVLGNGSSDSNARINAQNEYSAKVKTINNEFYGNQKVAALKLQSDLIDIENQGRAKRLSDEKRDDDLARAQQQAEYKKRLDDADTNNERLLNIRKAARDISLVSINDEETALREKNGFITEQQERKFNERRLAVETQFLNLSLSQLVDYYTKVIAIRKANGEDITKLEAALEDARLKLSQNNIKDLEDGEKREAKIYDNKIKSLQKLVNFANEFTGILKGAFDIGITEQKNALQDQADQIDKNKTAEIEAINATTLAASEKADRIAIINTRAQLQKEEIDRKQRLLDQQRARFDKVSNIASIISETALAVVRALGSKPYTPANIGLAAVTAALGAAQLAIAIATPIPKYKYGTQNHPGGLAEVGHGKVEYALLPSGEGFATPATPTQMYLPMGTKVYPDIDNLPEAIFRMAMKPARGMPAMQRENNEGVIKELKQLADVVRNKKEFHTKTGFNGVMAIHKYGESWTKYVDENIRF